MDTQKKVEMVLRLGVFGEFIGHGTLALQGKAQWVGWLTQIFHTNPQAATQLLMGIGGLDFIVAFVVLIKPIRIVLLWAMFWGFVTALLRPFMGESFWDFVERWPNWAAPFALLLTRGWPKMGKEWWK